MKQVTAFKCDFCGELRENEDTMRGHEKLCLEKREKARKAHEEYKAKEAQDIEKALSCARSDKAMLTLVSAGLREEARERANRIVWDEIVKDYGCSSWYECLFTRMVNAAAEVAGVEMKEK